MTAMAMPQSTPKRMTPTVATSESASGALAHAEVAAEDGEVHQRDGGEDHDRGQRRLREVGEQ